MGIYAVPSLLERIFIEDLKKIVKTKQDGIDVVATVWLVGRVAQKQELPLLFSRPVCLCLEKIKYCKKYADLCVSVTSFIMCISLMCTLPTKPVLGMEKKQEEMMACVEVSSERTVSSLVAVAFLCV